MHAEENPYLTQYTKINPKKDQRPNVRGKPVHLKRSIFVNFVTLG
jgi:hypothetical protein